MQLSGLSGSLILLVGFLASFPLGLLAYKTGRMVLICKLACAGGIAALISLAYFLRQPEMGAGIIVSCVALGFFALGCYPLALELVVECTYPVDQATGTAFIFLSSALQGVFLMQVENSFGGPLDEEGMSVQSCVLEGEHGHQQPKDYSSYLNFITVYMCSLIVIFIVFFRTELHRTNADNAENSGGGGGGGKLNPSATATTMVAVESSGDIVKNANSIQRVDPEVKGVVFQVVLIVFAFLP